jgi:hypothetical protein
MNILHFCETPLSGAPYRLAQVQKLAGHNARLVNHWNIFPGRPSVFFDYDIVLQDGHGNPSCKNEKLLDPKGTILNLIKSADILHFHNTIFEQYIFKYLPEMRRYVKSKLIVFQVHSPRRALTNVEKNLKDPSVGRRFVVAQYHTRQFPECTPVPNAIPIDDKYHRALFCDNKPPVITYGPSNKILRGWDNKGYAETLAALKQVRSPHQYNEVFGVPHLECLTRKQTADIAVDEVITGSYHLGTLEALSHGQVALCNLDDLCAQNLLDYTGLSARTNLPIVRANADTLASVLESFLVDPDKLKAHKVWSRRFMEVFWSPEYLWEHFKHSYEGTQK